MKKTITATGAAILLILSAQASAQWAKHPDTSIPQTRDGKPNLSARAPKARDGKPDFSGVWRPDGDPNPGPGGGQSVESIQGFVPPRYFVDITADMKPEEVPFQPSAAALFKQRLQSQGKEDPVAHCKPTGVPAIGTIPLPYKILQTPTLVVILYEENLEFRQIFLDGRRRVQDPQPTWMGYSTGKWDGDTLVVDTVGFNDKSWLDRLGHPHSDALHVIERFRRRDMGHLEIEVTIDDPKAYTKPITYTQKATLLPGEDLMEYFCSENEKDVQHFQ
jgi:hypothetical protein